MSSAVVVNSQPADLLPVPEPRKVVNGYMKDSPMSKNKYTGRGFIAHHECIMHARKPRLFIVARVDYWRVLRGEHQQTKQSV